MKKDELGLRLKDVMIPLALITILALPILVVTVEAQEEERYFFKVNALLLKGQTNPPKIAEVLIEEFKKIGIKFTYEVVDSSVFNERSFKTALEKVTDKEGGYDLHLVGYGFGAAERDPDQLSTTLNSLARWPGGWNWWHWSNADVDRLFIEGRTVLDRQERYPIYSKIQEIFADEVFCAPIYFGRTPMFLKSDFEGYEPVIGLREQNAFNWYFKNNAGGTMRLAYSTDPVKLLPYWGNLGSEVLMPNIWESLVAFDIEYNPVPELAKSWNISEDGLTYTFHLYENVTWHDGVQFTAKDVVFTFQSIGNKETGTSMFTHVDQNIESVEAPDDYTVIFHLKSMNPGVMSNVFGNLMIVPKHLMENIPYTDWRDDDIANKHPIGTGPFKFVEWVPQQYFKLEANEAYYRGRPILDEIISMSIPDRSTALAAFRTGDIHMLSGSGLEAQFEDIKNDPNVKVYTSLSTTPFILGINLEHPILSNKYVRKAMSAAIPRDPICNDLLQGFAIPASSILNERHWVWNSSIQVPQYNIQQAKAYMEMAGYNFEWLEPPPETPISEKMIYAVIGLVVGLGVGIATRWLKR